MSIPFLPSNLECSCIQHVSITEVGYREGPEHHCPRDLFCTHHLCGGEGCAQPREGGRQKLTDQFEPFQPVLSPHYLHPAASLASPGCGAIRDAEERPEPETPRQHPVHVLPVDGKGIPWGEVERTVLRTKPHITHSSRL